MEGHYAPHFIAKAKRCEKYLQFAFVFKQAISCVIKDMENEPSLSMHALGNLPLLFLFRQYLELELKGLIIEFSPDVYENDFFKHDILKLVDSLKKVSGGYYENRISKKTEKFIKEFGKFDKEGQIFRYPESKKGEIFFPSDIIGNKIYEGLCNFSELKARIEIVLREFENLEGDIDYGDEK